MIDALGFSDHRFMVLTVVFCLLLLNLNSCCSLNDEGLVLLRFRERIVSDPYGALWNWNDEVGIINPCSWFGVECSEGNVVVLNLKDLCLEGTLAPELGNLFHIKFIILRNNSFSGIIPEEIGRLKELEVLDLGYNNFSGPIPSDIGNNLSVAILLLDNNELFGTISTDIRELKMLSEFKLDENQLSGAAQRSFYNEKLISRSIVQDGDAFRWRLLETTAKLPTNHIRRFIFFSPPLHIISAPTSAPALPPLSDSPKASTSPSSAPSSDSPQSSPSPSPALSSESPQSSTSPSPAPSSDSPQSSPSPSPVPAATPVPDLISPSPAASDSPPLLYAPSPSPLGRLYSRPNHHRVLILSAAIGGPALLLTLVIGVFFCQSSKVAVVKPWATGLSGQLQKAFVTGVPKLKRSELEAACEDFSNVIGSSSAGTIYKGTLSSGVEIAVISLAATSAKEWPKNLESQFRKKIDMLSKVNHKNFVNLLGYCEEEEPFTRMMVFEYAPNGTLFEHLHIKEAEHLDWAMRMRIAMGMAYCLDHMHQLAPPITHKNLNSSAISLSEDYAAMISDFGFWTEIAAAEMKSNPESNVYSFGVVLFEMMTGRLPYSVNSGSLEDWASDYLREDRPLREMLDPTLETFQEDQLERIGELIKTCVNPNPRQRPRMRQVVAELRDITAIGPDGAIPKLSPLWWAELEILSTEAS